MASKVYRLEHNNQTHYTKAINHQQAKYHFLLEFGPNASYNWKSLRLHKIERKESVINHFVRHTSHRASYIAAKTDLIKRVGVIDQLSRFSYISNTRKTIFLDEDVDFKIFSEAYNKMFGRYPKVFRSQSVLSWAGEWTYDEFTMETLNAPKKHKTRSKQQAQPAPPPRLERPNGPKALAADLLKPGINQKTFSKK